MKKGVLWVLTGYQIIFSPDTGIFAKGGVVRPTCVFYPTCSEYTKQSVEKYGTVQGLFRGFRRILRCHPWQKEHNDPVR
jgi:uncharacterized protein